MENKGREVIESWMLKLNSKCWMLDAATSWCVYGDKFNKSCDKISLVMVLCLQLT